jgi:transglutaminase-like putative cysteine protease
MLIQVTHETRYEYAPPVEVAQHMAYLRPLDTPTQQVLLHLLDVEPTPDQQLPTQDIYGNTRTYLSLQSVHERLRVLALSTVQTTTSPAPPSTIGWEQVREHFRYRARGGYDAASEFVFTSPYVPRHADFAAYARASFGPGVPLLAAAQDLMHRIHTDFVYESNSTEVGTPALLALSQRKGVCQDFAHIMIGCLRSLGLAARYVSGYLVTQPAPGQPRLIGSDASHAWISVLMPDLPAQARWVDFDPTNDRWGWNSPGEDYVVVATGRDYADVSPIRGVIHGGASHQLHVAVTVMPLDDDLPAPRPASAAQPAQGQTQSRPQAQSQSQSQSQVQVQGPHGAEPPQAPRPDSIMAPPAHSPIRTPLP